MKSQNQNIEMSRRTKQEIQLCSYDIFKENNRKKRNSFFSNSFIQYLWTIYIQEVPMNVIDILRFVKSIPHDGEFKFEVFMDEILALEREHNLTIVPHGANNRNKILPFTSQEQQKNSLDRRFRRL